MEMRYIGRTGLRVSKICLGTMTFGSQCDRGTAYRIMDKALDHGVNFFDTAEIYPVPPEDHLVGITESIVGDWISDRKIGHELIIATKVAGSAAGWFVPPVRHGLTALDSFHIRKAVENSLRRLKREVIDLYQTHWPDPIVPIEETLAILDSLVKEGKIRYFGSSNDTAYGLTKSTLTSQYHRLARYESIQNNFSFLNQRFKDELALVCRQEKISLLPYSPLAGGVLSGKYQNGFPDRARFSRYKDYPNKRSRLQLKRFLNERSRMAVDGFLDIAKHSNLDPVTMAIAWTCQQDYVASAIIGATQASQLDASLAAANLHLPSEILQQLEALQKQNPNPLIP